MPTTFFGWVGFLLEQYGPLFAAGTAMTLLISLSGTVLGFIIGLLVAIVRTIEPARGAGSIRRALLGAVHALMKKHTQAAGLGAICLEKKNKINATNSTRSASSPMPPPI